MHSPGLSVGERGGGARQDTGPRLPARQRPRAVCGRRSRGGMRRAGPHGPRPRALLPRTHALVHEGGAERALPPTRERPAAGAARAGPPPASAALAVHVGVVADAVGGPPSRVHAIECPTGRAGPERDTPGTDHPSVNSAGTAEAGSAVRRTRSARASIQLPTPPAQRTPVALSACWTLRRADPACAEPDTRGHPSPPPTGRRGSPCRWRARSWGDAPTGARAGPPTPRRHPVRHLEPGAHRGRRRAAAARGAGAGRPDGRVVGGDADAGGHHVRGRARRAGGRRVAPHPCAAAHVAPGAPRGPALAAAPHRAPGRGHPRGAAPAAGARRPGPRRGARRAP